MSQRNADRDGVLYVNVGHTGLDEKSLVSWIKDNGLRAVFFIHDLIPLLHPEYCRSNEGAKHAQRMRNVLASAYGIIANSQATIEDIGSFASARGFRMPPSVAAWIAGVPASRHAEVIRLDRPHFIVVGTIEGRKNHLLLLHIWRRLLRQFGPSAPMLVIAGQRGWEAEAAIAMLDRADDLAGHILELGKCGDDELAGWIAGARALLMPSFAEGFGIPVAEALQLGTPVIASDLPVFREFAGEIPMYLDPLDGPAWERAIIAFTADVRERTRQLQAMRGYEAPDWKTHFRIVEAWLEVLRQQSH